MGIVTKHYSDKNEPKSMGITGAKIGQIAKITAVDSDGKPTAWSPVDMPTTLPNPNALTFTGAVTGSYDGSEAKTINIPTVDDVIAALPTWEGGSY